MRKTFCVVGTDARQRAAAKYLKEAGYNVTGAEGAGSAGYILLPMPLDADMAGLARILRAAQPGTLALGGRVSAPVQAAADAAGVELIDYFLRPELASLNAVPTAEGCIGVLLSMRDRTLWESPVLVLGYGRVGSALAARLHALGAYVTVAARSAEQRAQARSAGCEAEPLEMLPRLAPGFDAVVNTIPAPVLGRAALERLPGAALVVDLASMPGGVDFAAAKALGVHTVHALSLPARCAPRTAGELVAHTVLTILQERSSSL
ncbi:MAG: NAD(P)-dependent oxidoreductase [Gemmiger sp.]